MTDNDKLAEWCGLRLITYSDTKVAGKAWSSKTGFVCWKADWNPAKDPRQWYMILQALVKKRTFYLCAYAGHGQFGADLAWTPTKLVDNPDIEGASSVAQAIIDAAMAVIESEENDANKS